jgi:hypothetical protein
MGSVLINAFVFTDGLMIPTKSGSRQVRVTERAKLVKTPFSWKFEYPFSLKSSDVKSAIHFEGQEKQGERPERDGNR